MSTVIWKDQINKLTELVEEERTAGEIGAYYGVSRQRIYQVLTKFGISCPHTEKKNFLRGKPSKYYWVNKTLALKKFSKIERLNYLETQEIPDVCPMLGIVLNYDGNGGVGYTRSDDSPSIDRIDNSDDYHPGNIQIISWRANRIKNDSTLEELEKIYLYMKKRG